MQSSADKQTKPLPLPLTLVRHPYLGVHRWQAAAQPKPHAERQVVQISTDSGPALAAAASKVPLQRSPGLRGAQQLRHVAAAGEREVDAWRWKEKGGSDGSGGKAARAFSRRSVSEHHCQAQRQLRRHSCACFGMATHPAHPG